MNIDHGATGAPSQSGDHRAADEPSQNADRQTPAGGAGVSRRRVMAASAALAAAAALSRRVLGKVRGSGRVEDVHLALAGHGAQGRRLLENLLKMEGVRLRAVCDLVPGRLQYGLRRMLAYKHDARGYVDFGEMISAEKDLDGVLIATPDWMHAPHAIAALQAGRHVYCEKEMSNDLALAREMVLTARRTGKLLQIGHQRRSNPRYLRMLEYLRKYHAVGRITHVQGQWNRYRALRNAPSKKRAFQVEPAVLAKYGYDTMEHLLNWRWYKRFSGGPIADLGSHQVDIFNWILAAPPRAVMAVGGRDYYQNTEWADNVNAFYEWQCEQAGKPTVVRGVYQVLNTTSHGGYFEAFLGDEGSIVISENTRVKTGIRRERLSDVADWETSKEMLAAIKAAKITPAGKSEKDGAAVVKPPSGGGRILPLPMPKGFAELPVHRWHLENFVGAIRDPKKVQLTCPGEVGYETAASVLPVNAAMAKHAEVQLAPESFRV